MLARRLSGWRCCCFLALRHANRAALHTPIRAASGANRQPSPPAAVFRAGSRSRLAARPATKPAVEAEQPEEAQESKEVQEQLQRLGLKPLPLGQHHALLCPECRGGRSGEKSLSVKVTDDGFSFNCFRATCGWKGGYSLAEARRRAAFAKPDLELSPLGPAWLDFFARRGISPATLQRNRVRQTEQPGPAPPAVVFPYYRDGELVNVKCRTLDKKMWQHKNAEKILFGWDDIKGADEVILVEGELDKLALEEAGFRNVASVPNGAPPRVKEGRLPPQREDKLFSYIWDSQPAWEQARRFLLATDGDAPGRALAEELSRRLGPERCWLVTWQLPPQPQPLPQRQQQQQVGLAAVNSAEAAAAEKPVKDANDVLMAGGAAAVQACVQKAVPYPVAGLTSVASLIPALMREHAQGPPPLLGLQTGWRQLDALYRVRPACVTVISGPPGAGKTALALDLLCRLAQRHSAQPPRGFTSGLCLFDNQGPEDVLKALLERQAGKPFAAPQASQQMSRQEAQAGLDWLASRFVLVHGNRSSPQSLEDCLRLARIAAIRNDLKGLLIDSAQALAPGVATADGAVGCMRELRDFAKEHALHVWLVAHQLAPDDTRLLLQLADTGLALHRQPMGASTVTVHAANRECSRPGTVAFALKESGRRIVPQ